MATGSDRGRGNPGEDELERRERAVAARESAVSEREELDRLRAEGFRIRAELSRVREEALQVRERAEEAGAERARLAAEVREVNESLVLALTRSQELADEADAARAVLAASEERFRSLVTTSAAIVWQADALGRVRVDPERWRDYTGLDACEPGDRWLDAVHPEDRRAAAAAWAAAAAAVEGTVFNHQHRLRKGDGGHTWVVTRAVPLQGDGPAREWVGTMTDVSDRVRLEEAREEFIAILGHDLRNPPNIVLMATQALRQGHLAEPQVQNVGQILRSVGRMEGMIRDLLDFARSRLRGGIPVMREATDLRRMGEEAVAAVKVAHPHRAVEYEASGDLRGEWDPARLEQVLANLLDNAILHGADPIRLTLRDEGTKVVAEVHSRGAPISADLLPGIFEPFHGRPRSRTEGLGLGLYIVHEIVRAHGGSITVRSSEQEGTTFAARWPRHPPAAPASRESPRLV